MEERSTTQIVDEYSYMFSRHQCGWVFKRLFCFERLLWMRIHACVCFLFLDIRVDGFPSVWFLFFRHCFGCVSILVFVFCFQTSVQRMRVCTHVQLRTPSAKLMPQPLLASLASVSVHTCFCRNLSLTFKTLLQISRGGRGGGIFCLCCLVQS